MKNKKEKGIDDKIDEITKLECRSPLDYHERNILQKL